MRTVNPVKRYEQPAYPTIDEIASADLTRAPARWARLKSVIASLGTVALTMKAFAQDAEPPAPTAVAPQPKGVKDKPTVAQTMVATDICPLLPVAVAGEGRGGFGCVAVNPPVMLSECEALEIIEREFAKRGIVLKDCPEIDGVELPSQPGKHRPVMLDFGNEQGDVLVEFISKGDIEFWKKPDRRMVMSTFNTYDVRQAATNAVAALEKRTTGKPVTIGIIYDPIARLPEDWDKDLKGELEAAEKKGDSDAWWKARQAAGRALAEKRLKAQLEGFFAHLAKQGKLPKEK